MQHCALLAHAAWALRRVRQTTDERSPRNVRQSWPITPCQRGPPALPRSRRSQFAQDSPLEGDGFEPSVPLAKDPGKINAEGRMTRLGPVLTPHTGGLGHADAPLCAVFSARRRQYPSFDLCEPLDNIVKMLDARRPERRDQAARSRMIRFVDVSAGLRRSLQHLCHRSGARRRSTEHPFHPRRQAQRATLLHGSAAGRI